MKKILIGALIGSAILTAGQNIKADFEGNQLHLNIKNDAYVDTNMQYYIDIDNNIHTGFSRAYMNVKGADYMVENGVWYIHDGEELEDNYKWKWTKIGGDWEQGKYNVSVPLSDMGLDAEKTIKVGAVARNSDFILTHNYNQYGSSGQEMRTISATNNPLTIEHLVPSGVSAEEAANALVVAVNKYNNINYDDNEVYEDGEDETTTGWSIYDDSPEGATISNVYDSTKNSRVIKFTGDGSDNGTSNGFQLGNYHNHDNAWNNTTDTTVQWSMKYSGDYVVYITVSTENGGVDYLYYTADADNLQNSNGNIKHGLGEHTKKGRWQTITRDLNADLQEFEPDNKITSIDGIMVRGYGKIDDIKTFRAKKDWQVLQLSKVKGGDLNPHNYLAVDGHTYILKICNGTYAEGLLENESDRPISMLMPCTLTVYERDGKIYIATMRAEALMGILASFSENAQNLLMKTSVQMEEMVQNTLKVFTN